MEQVVTRTFRDWFLEWPDWWRELPSREKWLPAVLVALYWATLAALGGFRSDHAAIGLVILALSYGGSRLRPLLSFLLPLLLTAIIYDSQRFYADLIRGPIHVEEPYLFDLRFFGIDTAAGRLTPNQWWQSHTHWFLDFVTGFFYLTFVALFLLTAAYYRFWVSRRGTARMAAAEIARRAPRIMWAFFWLNIVGYSTYYWYAAAPPWYVDLYGLGPADLSAQANPAGCLRFDALLGTSFFSGMYERSADVFGAIPSLHIAYPLLGVYYAFQFGTGRLWNLGFFLIMCFAAVYLNHHYVIDLIWGSAYALACGWLTDLGYEWLEKRRRAA